MTNPQHDRYLTQIKLREMGYSGQTALEKERVAIVGIGGLGSPCSLYLAGSGIGHLLLVDGDTIETENLHRQILFQENDLKRNKAETARKKLSALNSQIHISSYPEFLTADNIHRLLSSSNIIVDGADNFETKLLLNDYCASSGKIMIYGSANRWSGQVSLFRPGGTCLRCLFPHVQEGLFQNCESSGILGPVVGTIALLQAQLVLNWILSQSGEDCLYLYDAFKMRLEKIRIFKSCEHRRRIHVCKS